MIQVTILTRSEYGGVWEAFIQGLTSGVLYKFPDCIHAGQKDFKADLTVRNAES